MKASDKRSSSTAATGAAGSSHAPSSTTGAPPTGEAATEAMTTEPSISLPPLSAPPGKQTAPVQVAKEIARLDSALVGVVLILAFLLASFAARNSDYWMRMATSRLLVHGQYQFGVDPFAYTATAYWTNHSWLFDLALYGLASLSRGPESDVAGAVLVAVKALIITALAWVLLNIRRKGQSLWAPAFCTGFALLVMSPRLLLQPPIISFFFLGLTLYLLQRPFYQNKQRSRSGVGQEPGLPACWLLPPLFALWSNMDAWFLLGPLTVGLYFLGQILQEFLSPIRTGDDVAQPHQRRTLSLVLLAGLAACLLNPHHYHVFSLPPQLTASTLVESFDNENSVRKLLDSPLLQDRLFRPMFYSPWEDDYFKVGLGSSVVAVAYYVLIGVGVASFVMSGFAGWRWWRILLWVAYLALSGYQYRNIPFFAVVSGPIIALNVQDFAAARLSRVWSASRVWLAWSLAGRIATLLTAVSLILATWPGWLQERPADLRLRDARLMHRVAWRVETEPALVALAQQLKTWRTEGLLKQEDNGFNYHPDLVNYSAWFCADEKGLPQEKGFFDFRFQAFPESVATSYVELRRALHDSPTLAGQSSSRSVNWQERFRTHHINHVLLFGTDSITLETSVRLLQDWQQWSLVHLDGRTSIFQWRDPRAGADAEKSRLKRFDANALAFGPNPDRAPEQGPKRPPQFRELRVRFLQGSPTVPLDRDTATRYLAYYNQISLQWPAFMVSASHVDAWSHVAAGAGVTPGCITVPGTIWVQHLFLPMLSTSQGGPDFVRRDNDVGPIAAPLLAVRAARRAIVASPDDFDPYFTLARSYNVLWRSHEEGLGRPLGRQQEVLLRQKLRQVQFITALEYAHKLRPRHIDTRLNLYLTYSQLRYLDLALDHYREFVELKGSEGPSGAQPAEEFKRLMEDLRNRLSNMDNEVKRLRADFEVESHNQPLLDKVYLAIRKGLGKEGLELLLKADASQMERQEANMQLELLLATGQPEVVRERLTEDMKIPLGGINYDLHHALMDAATGNYRQAGQYLEAAIVQMEKSNLEIVLNMVRDQIFHGTMNPAYVRNIAELQQLARQLADLNVARALVAVEEGNIPTAARYFQKALDITAQERIEFDGKRICQRYLELMRQAGGAP